MGAKLTDVELAACRAMVEIRRLPRAKQGDAFALAVKMVIEGGAIPIEAASEKVK